MKSFSRVFRTSLCLFCLFILLVGMISISRNRITIVKASVSGISSLQTLDLHVYIPIIASPYTGTTTLISRHSDGTQADKQSTHSSISTDSRIIAFSSLAANLVDGDANNAWDIFVHDRQTGQTTRVSLHTDGTEANYDSFDPSISADGRIIAFWSSADNLVDDDSNGKRDVFVHDCQSGVTNRVSRHTNGMEGIEASDGPSISADGRFVAFNSFANNLVDNDINDSIDVFVRDLQTGETTLISRNSNGKQGNKSSLWPSISGDGRFVAFGSYATDLTDNDTNGENDIFVHDRHSGETSLVSRATNGEQANHGAFSAAFSADGRNVAFISYATNLVANDLAGTLDVFVHDRQTGETTKVSRHTDGTHGNDRSEGAAISGDGRFVAFVSESSNLVYNDTNQLADVFIHDRQTAVTSLVSRDSRGTLANGSSDYPAISYYGRFVSFLSHADNLVSGDDNGNPDVFVVDREE